MVSTFPWRARYYSVVNQKTEYPYRLVLAGVIGVPSLWTLLFLFAPGLSVLPLGPGDAIILALLAVHVLWMMTLVFSDPAAPVHRESIRIPAEGMFFVGLFLFLFAYIFALNANMDYVQRFVAAGGNLQIAPDTRTERLIAVGRHGPLLLLDLSLWLWAARDDRGRHEMRGVALVLFSVALSVLAFPSFLRLQGIAALGFVSLAPLLLAMFESVDERRYARSIWYGVLYGVLTTLIGNYWLGTFNLISLQAVGIIFFGFYMIFIPVLVAGLAILRGGSTGRTILRAILVALAWTGFEFGRSSGFLGYPWLLTAHSQYRFTAFIQIAELGGVWLVSFVVVLVNALLAVALRVGTMRRVRRAYPGGLAGAAAGVLVLATVAGMFLLNRVAPGGDPVRMALIQQNSDPRKHAYEETFETLRELTDRSLAWEPDLVVWSETAFVPNIRRWSQEDPERYRLARLVREFLAYQRSIETWLLTGNDDYRRIMDDDGNEIERQSFNAAVLLSDRGERRETYHKMKLVPFTEHFPYEEQLPWIYNMLLDFDIAFWTPGDERVVFEHPKVRFSTPICFEDVFPGEVRKFARAGAEVIVNISNDYWSLNELAAKQHFVGALFRTVELRRPMVRSTASGLTGHIDATGRILATTDQYEPRLLVADVRPPVPDRLETLYFRWGDWFPWTAIFAFFLITVGSVLANVISRTGRKDRDGR